MSEPVELTVTEAQGGTRLDTLLAEATGGSRSAASEWIRDGRAEVAPVDRAADVTLSAETLASLYLGGTRVPTLRRAGRIAGTDDAVARLGRLMDGGPAPYSLTSF